MRPVNYEKMILLLIVTFLVISCGGNNRQYDQEPSTENTAQTEAAVPAQKDPNDSLRNINVVTFAAKRRIRDDVGNVSNEIFTIKSNGTDEKVLGRVENINHGPVVYPKRKMFIYVGKPTIDSALSLYAHWFEKDSTARLIQLRGGIAYPQRSDDERYAYVFRFGDVIRYDFETGENKTITSITSKYGAKVSRDGRFVCGYTGEGLFRKNIKTGERTVWATDATLSSVSFSDDCRFFKASIKLKPYIVWGELIDGKPLDMVVKNDPEDYGGGMATYFDTTERYFYHSGAKGLIRIDMQEKSFFTLSSNEQNYAFCSLVY